MATLASVLVHDPGVSPKSSVPIKVQWELSLAVTMATRVDVQLSSVTTLSTCPSESSSEYAPATYVQVAIELSTSTQVPGVTPKSAVDVKVQWFVSAGVTIGTTVDAQLSGVSIVSNCPLAENIPGA